MNFTDLNKNKKNKAWFISLGLITLSVFIFTLSIIETQKQINESSVVKIEKKPQVLGANINIQAVSGPENTSQTLVLNKDSAILDSISAKAYIIFDLASGQVLLSKNADDKLPIASLTKLMTGFIAYKELNMTDLVEFTQDFTDIKPVIGIKPGIKYKVEDLFRAMLVGSANDAGQALAFLIEKEKGKDMSVIMNDYAQELQMLNSHFSNPLGFDSGLNYSTAQDLKILITSTQKLYAFSSLGKKLFYEFSDGNHANYKVFNTNKLLKKHPEFSAIKTGFTENSLGSMVTKTTYMDRDVVIVVLGSQNREKDTENLARLLTTETKISK